MTEEEVLNIVREVGIKKGYRIDHPTDWYGGISKQDFIDFGFKEKKFNKYLHHSNDLIKKLFSNIDFEFVEWMFKRVVSGFWKDKNNILLYLRWFEIEMGWNNPDDWYKITEKDIYNHNGGYLFTFYKSSELSSILYPNHIYYPWKFKQTIGAFWKDKNNIILYLKWLENELGWNKEEDWYNISQKILIKNYGSNLLNTIKNLYDIPSVLYPNFDFDIHKFNTVGKKYWNNFENLRPIIIEFYKEYNRMPTFFECKNINGKNIVSGILRQGGINKIAKKLGIQTLNQFKVLSGDVVRSSYEIIFSNFLFLNNIPFQYEGKIIDDCKYEYDFKIEEYYIEIWGMMHRDDYCEKRILKEMVYKDNNLKLISIEKKVFSENLECINSYLISLMKEYNIKQNDFYEVDLNLLKTSESFGRDKILSELKEYCLNFGVDIFPTFEEWIELGFKKHMNFLSENNISINDIAKNFGLKTNRVKRGYLQDLKNVEYELKLIIDKLGKFPDIKYLTKNHSPLFNAVSRYFGGFKGLKQKMGYQNHTNPL